MEIKQFTFDRVLTKDFLNFGRDLYRGDPQWIPPPGDEPCDQLSREFAFYSVPGNRHTHFLAVSGGRVVGRVSAMVNRDLKDRDGHSVGTFGFFECVDDYPVARDLLDSAVDWLLREKGIDRIWGPMNFDIWHGYRMMTKGFDQRLFYGEPYNKPYYPGFLERYGFSPKQHWDSVEITGRSTLEAMVVRGEGRYRLLVDGGYRFEPFDMEKFSDELRKLHSLLLRSFAGLLGFTSIPFEEFERLFSPKRYAFHPRLFTFVYDEKGVPVGFAGAFLELSDAIRAMNGRDNAVARLKFLVLRRSVDRVLFYIIGITPEEEAKRSGLGLAEFYHIVRRILTERYETVVLALMVRGERSRRRLAGGEPGSRRQYTLYEYATDGSAGRQTWAKR